MKCSHPLGRHLETQVKIFNLENKVAQTKKMVRNHEQNLQKLWDIMKRSNLRILRIEEGT